jgi:hypothetical protein
MFRAQGRSAISESMRHCVKWGFLSSLLFALHSSPARAEGELGQAGTFAISAERLFGVTFASVTGQRAGVDVSAKQTLISLLNNGSASTSGDRFASAYSTARIGADYFIIPGLSVGGNLGFFTFSDSNSDGSTTQDAGNGNGILVAGRAGYAYMFTPKLGIWPRGGLTYMGGHAENADASVQNGATALALTLEVPFVITPMPHLAFLIYPFWDIGLSGSRSITLGTQTNTTDANTHGIGIQTGITGYF